MSFEKGSITVRKFGGTSMDDMEQVEQIANLKSTDTHPVLVVSAFSGVTDKLIALTSELMPFEGGPNKRKADETAFEPFIQDTLQRIRAVVSQKDGADLSHAESFLRQYVSKVLEIFKSHAHQMIFCNKSERPLMKEMFKDNIISIGEVFSAHALSVVLTARSEIGRVYKDVNTSEIIPAPVSIHPVSGAGKVELYQNIGKGLIKEVLPVMTKAVPVVPGYVGTIPGSITKTIDRGYTDSTAAILARAFYDRFGTDGWKIFLEIWKEVPGLFSGDPRLVEPGYNGKTYRTASDFKVAQLRRTVTFREAAELSAGAGMKAINANGIFALHKSGVNLSVRNTFDIHDPGTQVMQNDASFDKNTLDDTMKGIRFVSGKKNQTMFTVESDQMVAQEGVAADILNICKSLGVGVDVISTSATSLSFSVNSDEPNIEMLHTKLHSLGQVEREDKLALVCCIGNNMRGEIGLLAKLSGVFANNGVNIEYDGGNKDSNLTFVVSNEHYEKAVKLLHSELF